MVREGTEAEQVRSVVVMPREPCATCGVRIFVKPTRIRPHRENKCYKCFREDIARGIDRCEANTLRGKRCKHQQAPGSRFCVAHQKKEVKT